MKGADSVPPGDWNSPGPQITVIVCAWSHLDQVKNAVLSVESQSVASSTYELVVVTRESSVELNAWLKEHGARLACTESSEIGARWLSGIAIARGELVCFLDDDDEFSREKLRVVTEEFQGDGRLVFLHNGFLPIGPDGAAASWTATGWSTRSHPSPAEPLSVEGEEATKRARGDNILHADFNNSCISFRRSVLLQWQGPLSRVSIASDAAFLYFALLSGGKIKTIPAQLTRYRLHPGNTLAMSGDSTRLLDRYGQDYAWLKEVCATAGATSVGRLAELNLRKFELYRKVFDTRTTRRDSLGAWRRLQPLLEGTSLRVRWAYHGLAIALTLSPRLVREAVKFTISISLGSPRRP